MSQKRSWQAIGNIINNSLIEKAASLHRKYRKAKDALNKTNKQLVNQGILLREYSEVIKEAKEYISHYSTPRRARELDDVFYILSGKCYICWSKKPCHESECPNK